MSVVVSGDGEECRGTVAIRHKGGPGLVSNSQRLMWAESVSLPSSANHILPQCSFACLPLTRVCSSRTRRTDRLSQQLSDTDL